ncbi:Centrosomal protein of 164 kDa [Symbiodinium microadriaticum]|uniref:Centrosomal protein of 164 kDa n=1 Tax=Symbiodinium microadriaticum TaxID=2951 RepID=A0A1Q9DTM5_SYMMI|nr:Centrosomal protein of 164 kDa [Symbiodinium microadriaticum]
MRESEAGPTMQILPVASIVTPVERQVHSLGIDHVREADMVWIAEEAYNAPLPPGWTEHVDANGRSRTYFYNTNLRESLWKHPMDQEFVEIANYWRRALKDGGFWDIDEELVFYFNRKTEESLFDDPRHTTYHSLYTRIRRQTVSSDG